jgi:DNA-binding NarL/FixJ family response regulator
LSLRKTFPAAYTGIMGDAEVSRNDSLGSKGPNPPENQSPFDSIVETGESREQIRVLIIDGHEAVRHALRVRLSVPKHFKVVGISPHPDAATNLVSKKRTDVVVLGLQTNSENEMVNMVSAVHDMADKAIVVIILAPYADAVERELLINAGAKRYLLKHINSDQLIHEIESAVSSEPSGKPIRPQ